jgi:uncharacterized membrane protein
MKKLVRVLDVLTIVCALSFSIVFSTAITNYVLDMQTIESLENVIMNITVIAAYVFAFTFMFAFIDYKIRKQ